MPKYKKMDLSACTKTLQAINLIHIFVYGLWYFVKETHFLAHKKIYFVCMCGKYIECFQKYLNAFFWTKIVGQKSAGCHVYQVIEI